MNEPAPTNDPGPPASGRQQVLAAVPILLALLALLTLTGLNLNGSSVGLLSASRGHDSALVTGKPLGIRSDEWNISSPNLVGNVRRGLPVEPWIGMAPTFLPGSAVAIPTRHWSTAFKPQDWAFLNPEAVPGLSIARAFAVHWWFSLFIGFVGVYAVLFLLCRNVLVSSGLATMVTLAPVTAWWSGNPALAIGYLTGALAALLMATTRRRWWASLAWGAIAGWLLVADVLVLYPPWQVSLGWVCAAIGIGWLLDRRPRPSRVIAGLGAMVAVAIPALALWYLQSREAILAQANTYYPGNRLSSGGGGSLAWLLDAPSSLWLSSARPAVLNPQGSTFLGDPLPFANPSEVSSGWIPLPLLAVAALVAVLALVTSRRTARGQVTGNGSPGADGGPAGNGPPDRENQPMPWTGALTAGVTLLLLSWMLLPVPEMVGQVTLLGRVTGRRMPVAVALASAVLLATAMTVVRQARRPRWLGAAVIVAALGTVAATVWAVGELPWRSPQTAPPTIEVAAVALVLAAGAGLLVLGRLPRTAAAGLGLLALVTYLPVNPVYRGLGPLDHDPVVRTLVPMVRTDQGLRAVAYGHSLELSPLVIASGAQTLSGLTVYPDAEVWQHLAPGQEPNWNQYSKYDWIADPTASRPIIRRVSGTQQDLVVNPCSEQVRRLDIDVSLSPDPIDAECLTLQAVIPRGTGEVYLYRYR
jgi:hypothetical protein